MFGAVIGKQNRFQLAENPAGGDDVLGALVGHSSKTRQPLD
jgi:hypothetical protein